MRIKAVLESLFLYNDHLFDLTSERVSAISLDSVKLQSKSLLRALTR